MSLPPPTGDSDQLNPHASLTEPEDEKLKQLKAYGRGFDFQSGHGRCPFLSLQTGVRQQDDDHSLKAGTRGPTLLEDQVLREKINHFDHERIPERVVHARGTGAHGYFELYKSLSHLTTAAIFQDTKQKTHTFVRFSTVLGSKGSLDTARDVRGFATKFYAQEGNWDLVGNNIPIFFIQDAMKFPDLVHAGKPEPQTEMPQAATAHDNFWDFISWTPESMHMMAWAMSDRAIPRSFRMMQGFGVHTFSLVNADGKRTFVKFHWRPLLGLAGLAWDECVKLGGVDPDFHRRDLYEAINTGNFPEYELGIQCVPEENEEKFEFDLLDPTKIIPEELVPIQWIGKMTLNRVPTDFFAEVEQVAFCTQNVVPGIDFTNDPLLQGRNFSYLDTQLSRLGSANFNQIPINQPIISVVNNQRDGHMQMRIPTDKLNYFPNRNSAIGKAARPTNGGESQAKLMSVSEERVNAFQSYKEKMDGLKQRIKAPKFLEFFGQLADGRRNSATQDTPEEQAHMLSAASFELSKVDDRGVRERMRDLWNEMDHEFAVKLATNIGVGLPKEPEHKNSGQKSKFLSMISSPYTPGNTIATRKVACLIGDGFRQSELNSLTKSIEKEGGMLVTIGLHKGVIYPDGMLAKAVGSLNLEEETKVAVSSVSGGTVAGLTIFNCKSVLFDSLVLIGGSHIPLLEADGSVLAFINESLKHCKVVGACSEAISLLSMPSQWCDVKLADGTNSFVTDSGIVTSTAISDEFISAFIANLKLHRFWQRKTSKIPA